MNYCECELPIRITRNAKDGYKQAFCSTCMLPVSPNSKAINKEIVPLRLLIDSATRNEILIQDKINEIIDLIKANGGMI
jgi:hypothetical protein